MKCLMYAAEWVESILEDPDFADVKAWSTDYRGEVLLGCKKTNRSNPFLFAVAELSDVVFIEDENCYEWRFTNTRTIYPVKAKEGIRLFDVDVPGYQVISDDEVNAAYDKEEHWMKKSSGARRR